MFCAVQLNRTLNVTSLYTSNLIPWFFVIDKLFSIPYLFSSYLLLRYLNKLYTMLWSSGYYRKPGYNFWKHRKSTFYQ